MSRVPEIKRKEALQAKFQLAMGQANSQAASWLGSLRSDVNITPIVSSNDEFMALPILSEGSGLSIGGQATIGEFVASGIKNKNKNGVNTSNGAVSKDSKALNALRNKMRNANRMAHKAKQHQSTTVRAPRQHPQHKQVIDHGSDSDSDEDVKKTMTRKKTFKSFLDKR